MTPFFIYDGLYIGGQAFRDHDYYAWFSSSLGLISYDGLCSCNHDDLLYKNRERELKE
jgi:hypothetical protein